MLKRKRYENIETERLKKRLSSNELAKQLGVSRGTLSAWQKNGNIPATKLIAMSQIFNCSVDYLLGLDMRY